MAAERREEAQRRRRRKRLIQGMLVGSAAVGLPALLNAFVSRRARRLPPATWGTGSRYAWRHGDIVFQRLGEGPPLLVLHGLGPGHSAAEWRQVAELLATDYEVFVPDLLGWGRSDKPALAYDSELYIRLIADFAQDVIGDRTVLVAAGLPASYAVQVAIDHPERVRGLALVVPLGVDRGDDEPDLKDAVVHRLLRLPVLGTSALNLFTSRSGIAGYLRREVFGNEDLVDERLVEDHYRASHLPGAHRALAAFVSGYLNHGIRDVLATVTQPVWLAWGRKAASPGVESADLWLQRLSSATLEVLERCGAQPHAESPAELVRKLERFLESLP